ncbi:YjjW family glycine radical enzyme activase [Shewanella sp. S-1]|uniref:YjjW family glycine radical enzyme activase n=1 Tax=Shewanella oncorhynchi TaxID=2726434 RepID=A0ABX1KRP9_9GAMM|nr:YjjW family glycine radical enzyme activase [Shewanella oncorhynchi]NLQ24863.1 YjjW family glycine radical enzyme activase [Shewanella oncorhynchi]
MNTPLVSLNRHAIVSQLLPFSCVDGPGSRLVLFLQGCNYQCKNCHNPHTIGLCDACGDCVATCPDNALTLINLNDKPRIHWDSERCSQCDTCIAVCPKQASPKVSRYTVEEILTILHSQRHFINGITVSGGEASLQLPFILALFKGIKATESLSHLTCMLDTNGSLSLTGWHKLLPFLDGAMVDLKAWQQDTHRYITGRDNHAVFKSIQLLAKQQKLYEVRLLHIPSITDYEDEIEALATYLLLLGLDTRVKLNAFHHHGVVDDALNWPSCKQADIERLAAMLAKRGVTNLVLPSIYL